MNFLQRNHRFFEARSPEIAVTKAAESVVAVVATESLATKATSGKLTPKASTGARGALGTEAGAGAIVGMGCRWLACAGAATYFWPDNV